MKSHTSGMRTGHNHTPYMAHKTIVREILKKEFDLITQCALPIQSYKPAEIN